MSDKKIKYEIKHKGVDKVLSKAKSQLDYILKKESFKFEQFEVQ